MNYLRVPIGRGLFALIDAPDADLVVDIAWSPDHNGHTIYAICHIGRTTAYMHSLLTGFAMTDHVNGNGLDNRRVNLREATHVENARNMRKSRGSSQFKGVSARTHRIARPWRARIKVGVKEVEIGVFADERSAALAYDAAARQHFGEFAALNFPQPGERSAHDNPIEVLA